MSFKEISDRLKRSLDEVVLSSNWSAYDYISFFEAQKKSLVKTDFRKPENLDISFPSKMLDPKDVINDISNKIEKYSKMINTEAKNVLVTVYGTLLNIEQETIVAIEHLIKMIDSAVLNNQKVLEITSLLAKANDDVDSIDIKPLVNLDNSVNKQSVSNYKSEWKDLFLYNAGCVIILNNQLIESLEHKDEQPLSKEAFLKEKVWKTLKSGWSELEKLFSAKLPKSTLQALAYSNPLTAIVAQNWDLVSSSAKGLTKTAATVLGLEKE